MIYNYAAFTRTLNSHPMRIEFESANAYYPIRSRNTFSLMWNR